MANPNVEKTLREYSAPSADQVPRCPEINTGNGNFEIKTGLITMVEASPFCGKLNEDASAHLQQFLELCNTFTIRGVEEDAIRLRLFPFSLLGKAKQWFYVNCEEINTWANCSAAFLAKFFPLGKTNVLWGRISSFQQVANVTIPEAWGRIQEYILAYPHNGMDNWLILQNFYNGLTTTAQGHVDAAAGGAFFSLTIANATQLMEKMVSNQGWSNMLNAKMDVLTK
jgi:hypothetical protein